jgi:hypothetical protein
LSDANVLKSCRSTAKTTSTVKLDPCGKKIRYRPSEAKDEDITRSESDLKRFLYNQDKATLIHVLAELAEANEPVQPRRSNVFFNEESLRVLAGRFEGDLYLAPPTTHPSHVAQCGELAGTYRSTCMAEARAEYGR